MGTNQLILRNITYRYLKPNELRKAQIPAELISAAQIDVQSKYLGCDYGLFYINYQDKFELTIADTNNVSFLSRPFVHKTIENILNTKIQKDTNIINLEKGMNSEDIANLTEGCGRHFNKVEIVKIHLWELEENKLPKENIERL